MNKKEMFKTSKGITLIALVITIIILIILAGVSISILLGNDGLLNKATHAKKVTDIAQEKEGISIAFVSSKLNNEGYSENVTKENFDNSLKNQFGKNSNITTTDNKDGSFTVTFEDTDRVYYVESNGNIIENDKILKISTAEELKAFRDDVNSGNTYEGKYVFLTKDITLDISEEWQPIGLYLNTAPTPDDETNLPFKGIFDGQGHEINGIYINTTDKAQGLFGLVENGKVMNVGIGENNNITGGNATAGVVAYAYKGVTISNCYNKSNIKGSFGAGIVGCANTDIIIKDCYNTADIDGEFQVGGIVGYNLKTSIENCYNEGDITGGHETNDGVGGISGYNRTSTIKNCYNSGKVQGDDNIGRIGGIVGKDYDSSISLCYNEGEIDGYAIIGGIVGSTSQKSSITKCYNSGDVHYSGSYAGGICGFGSTSVEINSCYNKGDVIEDTIEGNLTTNIGGVVGKLDTNSKVLNCYNIGNVNTSANRIGGIIGNLQDSEISNCYNIGIINNINTVNTGEIFGGLTGTTVTSNNYSSKNIVKDENGVTIDGVKKLYDALGKYYKDDKNNINNGYPILSWQ